MLLPNIVGPGPIPIKGLKAYVAVPPIEPKNGSYGNLRTV